MVNDYVKDGCIAGIDPGSDGALAFLNPDGSLIATYRMPTYMLQRSSGQKRMIAEDEVCQILQAHTPAVVWIEDVWAGVFPKKGGRQNATMGVVSAFTFGEGKGILKGVCAGLGIRRQYVPPATWKAVLGVSADKKTSKRRALALFPGKEKLLTSVDKCEAALIAIYGMCAK